MVELLPELLCEPLSPPAQSLQEACHKAGLNRGGARCADCPLFRLCRDESRWVVSRRMCDVLRQLRR